jgi:anaerobic selenocysteine-containing dehydrogenase
MSLPLLVRGACPHDCPDTCGIITEVQDGRAVAVRGDPDHPIARGWLCAKVRPYLEHVYHPDRLTHPLHRVGPKGAGQWRRVTWDEALSEIAEKWQTIIAGSGAEAILPYSYSGTLGMVQNAVAAGRFWNRLGASQLERSICGAAAEHAVNVTLGQRWSPPYADVVHSRLVVLWGHNPVSTAPHFMPFLRQAQHNGCQLIVIDPRRSKSAEGADRHYAPLPGTDGFLAMGIAHVLVAEGLHDETWLNAHAAGWPEFRARLSHFAPVSIASKTGLSVEEIVGLARLYARVRPGLIKIADGINRNRNGGQNVRAVCALPALTGQYGVRGSGLAYSTSGYLQWDGPAVHHWGSGPKPGRSVNMNRLGAALTGEVSDPPIRALYVFNANPVTSSPNAGRIIEGLRRDDLFTVVHDLFLTDTADYADLVLPATSQLEHVDLHKAYGQTYLTYNRPAIAPLGESKSTWDVLTLLAEKLGFTEPCLHATPDEVIDEVLTATAAHNPALRGITLDRLKNEGTVPLNIESVPFAGERFPTANGKIQLYSRALASAGLDPLPGQFDESDDDGAAPERDRSTSLRLVSAASHHFVSSSLASQTGLLKNAGQPFIEIHPDDAATRGIVDGDTVVVENGRGWFSVRAVVTEAVRRGVAASPKGPWAKLSGGRNVNQVTSDALGDMAGQSTFHQTRVWIRKAPLLV